MKLSRLASLALVCTLLPATALAAPGLSVTPGSIQRYDPGAVELSATGIVGGEALLTLWVDVDRDGLAGPGDYTIWGEAIPDNVARWSPIQLNDSDPASGTITVHPRLLTPLGFPNTVGHYVWQVHDPGSGLEAETAFEVTEPLDTTQSISGQVTDGTDPVGGALVVLLPLDEECDDDEYASFADANGDYTIELPGHLDCNYRMAVALKPGYLGSYITGQVGVFTGTDHYTGMDLVLEPGTHAVTGSVLYSSGPAVGEGIPGAVVFADSDARFTIGFGDADGGYALALDDGEWYLEADEDARMALAGAVAPDSMELSVVVSGPTSLPDIEAPAVNAFVSGTLYDDTMSPVPGWVVEAYSYWPCDPDCYFTSVVTEADGSFVLGALAPDAPDSRGYGVMPMRAVPGLVAQSHDADLSAGDTLVDHDLEHLTPTAWITGTVSDLAGEPVGDLCLTGDQFGMGLRYESQAHVGCDGSYALPVVDGDWDVRFEPDDLLGFIRQFDTTPVHRQINVTGAGVEDVDLILGRFLQAPTLISAEPPEGPAGSRVVLIGYGIPQGATPTVWFDGTPATVLATRADLGRILVDVPAGLAPGPYSITFDNPEMGGMVSNPTCFDVNDASATPACTVTGHVTTNLGNVDVQDALVVALEGDSDEMVSVAVTDASGNYSLGLPAATAYDLLFIPRAGLARRWAHYQAVVCPGTQDHNFITGSSVSGRVVNQNGDGIPGVEVFIEGASIFASAFTDFDGGYQVWMPNGLTGFNAFAPPGSRYVNDQSVQVQVSGATVVPDIVMSSGHLFSGRLVDKLGDGLLGTIWAFDSMGPVGYTESDGCTGSFALAAHPGYLGLGLQADDFASSSTLVEWVPIDGDRHAEFDFAVFNNDALQYTGPEPRIAGEVDAYAQAGQWVGMDVENLAPTGVEIYFSDGMGGTVAGVDTLWDAGRGVAAARVPATADTGDMFVQVQGVDSAPFPFTLLPGTWDPGSFVFSGTVTDGGAPVEGALAVLMRFDPDDPDCEPDPVMSDLAKTDAAGGFSLTHSGGDLVFLIWPPTAGSLAPRLTMLEGVTGDVTGVSVPLVAGVPVHVRAVTGTPPVPVPNAKATLDFMIFDQRMTDANGEATLYAAPGDYEAELIPPAGSRLMLFGAEITAPVDLGDVPLSAGVFVAGRAIDQNGDPLPGTWINASAAEPPNDDFFDGQAGANGVGRGPVPSDTPFQGYVEAPLDNLADVGLFDEDGVQQDTILYPSLVLRPAGLVEGTLRDAESGAPLSWTGVSAMFDEGGVPGMFSGGTQTCDDGSYVLKVPEGTHFVQSFGDNDHVQGWYSPATPDDYCGADAEAVTVAEGALVSGVDIDLSLRSSINGWVGLFDTGVQGGRVSVTAGRLGSCVPEAYTDESGGYWLEVPAGSGYRVEADAPPGYFGPSQCYDGFDGCAGFTPVTAPPFTGAQGIDFAFGAPPPEVSGEPFAPQLTVNQQWPGSEAIILGFQNLPQDTGALVYNVYGGSLSNLGFSSEPQCWLHPGTFVDLGPTYDYWFTPAPGVEWLLVSASNSADEGPLGHSRTLGNACGPTP